MYGIPRHEFRLSLRLHQDPDADVGTMPDQIGRQDRMTTKIGVKTMTIQVIVVLLFPVIVSTSVAGLHRFTSASSLWANYTYWDVTYSENLIRDAKQGEVYAQFWLGVCYKNGKGVEKNVQEALKWIAKSAEDGCPYAQEYLGRCYEEGDGVPKDDKLAGQWFRKAAEQGDAGGQYHFAMFEWEHGKLVDAYKWYNLAAAHEDFEQTADAARGRNSIAANLSPEQIAEAQRLSAEFVPSAEGKHQGRSWGSSDNGEMSSGQDITASGSVEHIMNLSGYLMGRIVAILVGSLLIAFVFQGATRLVCKFVPTYGIAYIAAFTSTGVSILICGFIKLALAAAGERVNGTTIILALIVSFFASSTLLTLIIKRPDKQSIGFGNACLVSTIQCLVGIVICCLVAVIVVLAKR